MSADHVCEWFSFRIHVKQLPTSAMWIRPRGQNPPRGFLRRKAKAKIKAATKLINKRREASEMITAVVDKNGTPGMPTYNIKKKHQK